MSKLTLPERKSPGPGSFDTRLPRVEAWLATLPMANVGETTRQLYQTLREVNGLDIAPAQRLKFLETLRPALGYVSDAMKKHYVGRPFPLPQKSRTVAHLARELLRQSALGYAIVAHEESRKGRLRKDNRAVGTAIHRAMRCFGAILLNAYQVYTPVPGTIWGEVHYLLKMAIDQAVDHIPIKDTRHRQAKASTIADVYKETALLALTCPYRLRQGEVELVCQALETWAPLARLLDFTEPANPSGVFMINLRADSPPSYVVLQHIPRNTACCRLLDTAELADRVREQISASEPNCSPEQRRLPESVLHRLMLAWGVMPKRRYNRASKHSSVLAAIGLGAAHFFISGEMVFSPVDGESESDDGSISAQGRPFVQQRAQFAVGVPTSERGEPLDMWDVHRHNNEQALARLLAGTKLQETKQLTTDHYDAQPWKMVNISAGGYCLLWDNDGNAGAQVGELIALREQTDPDMFHWALGVIRWMKWIEGHGLELGVQMLSPGAVAIGLKASKHKKSAHGYVRSLLLPEIRAIDQPTTLLTPALPYRVDDTVTVYSHGKETRLKLTRQVENTGTFAQFHFTPLENRGGRASSTNDPRDPDFDAIWDAI